MDGLNRKIRDFSILFSVYFSDNFWRELCLSFLGEKKRENMYREKEREKDSEFGHWN